MNKHTLSPSVIGIALFSLALVGASCNSGAADGGVFRSEDNGVTWEQKVFIGQDGRNVVSISNADIQTIEVEPENPDVAYVGTLEDGIFKTETAGEQWFRLAVNPDRIRDIAIDPQNPDVVYAVRANTILKTVDAGETWEIIYTDTQNAIVTRIVVDWFNSEKVIAVTSIGTVLVTQDEGVNWQVVYKVDEPLVGVEMSPADSRQFYVVELDEGIHRTSDGGVTWDNLMYGEPDEDGNGTDYETAFREFRTELELLGANETKSMEIDPNNPSIIYVVTEAGVLKSRNRGESWEIIDTLIERNAEENSQIREFTVQPGDSDVLYFAYRNLIHRTENGAQTWKTIEDFPSQRRITAFYIDDQLLSEYPDEADEGIDDTEDGEEQGADEEVAETQEVGETEEQNTAAEAEENGEETEDEEDVIDRRFYIGVEKIEERRGGIFGGPPVNN